MLLYFIQCESCGGHVPVSPPALPDGWLTLSEANTEWHLCSKECLLVWLGRPHITTMQTQVSEAVRR